MSLECERGDCIWDSQSCLQNWALFCQELKPLELQEFQNPSGWKQLVLHLDDRGFSRGCMRTREVLSAAHDVGACMIFINAN